ncbi:heat shock protein 23-like [Contarinia nasturtii]|uniref:heat shock protein 23-like n=1 Tax=Contarinia nasturtii TaxID=265458 RepID=UPI0012D46272|nr:heat shock protein 23-like [Contarinia nasturtii]
MSRLSDWLNDSDFYDPVRYHYIDRSRHYPSVDIPFRRTFRCYKDADDYLNPGISNLNIGERKATVDKNSFEHCIDVAHFKPEEISVKVENNSVLVQAKHEEKQDEQGFISRQFTRRYDLPKNCKAEDVVSSLSSDGILSIKCAIPVVSESADGRQVPIQQTGQPSQSSTKNNADKNDGKETPVA